MRFFQFPRAVSWARRAACAALVSFGVAAVAESPADVARRAGLRTVEGRHLLLITDRAPRDADGVDLLPAAFDEAFTGWCRHYGIDPEAHRDWRAQGCLMVDRERFRSAGLLPADGSIPDFENGFCAAGRFWMIDQSNPDYRRHLLLHEGVHAFTITLRDAAAPPWYTEGIAEYLATHRIDDAGRLVPTPLPLKSSDVEQLGRIERLRSLHATGQAPGLEAIFTLPPTAHRELGAYAVSWAAVALLAGHPAYRDAFAATERQPLDGDFTTRLTDRPGWDSARAGRDFDAFLADLDYGYSFDRMTIDWSQGRRLDAERTVRVAADRGWQNSGWSLAAGESCSFRATGRVIVGRSSDLRLESEPDGITLRWYRGRPLGRLLAAQWTVPQDDSRPAFRVLAEGAAGTFSAVTDGPLYFKLNASPGGLADHSGTYDVTLK